MTSRTITITDSDADLMGKTTLTTTTTTANAVRPIPLPAHTPGPWRIADQDHPELATGDYHFISAGDGVYSPDHGFRGFEIAGYMSAADAALIAAAPELLAALNGLWIESGGRAIPNESLALARAKAAAAIAWARRA